MSIAEYISGALRRIGKQRKDLAHSLNLSPAAITRLLAKSDDIQTLGQMKAVADALGLHWHHAMYDPGKQSQDAKIIANTISHKPEQQIVVDNSFDFAFCLAVEHNLINLMRVEIEPKLHTLEVKEGEGSETVSLLGWHLGETTDHTSSEGRASVYWCIYVSHKDWNFNFNGSQNNILVFNEKGEMHLHSINHASSRTPIQWPNNSGRVYNSLESDIVMRSLGSHTHLIVENRQGVANSTHLIFTDIQSKTDLFDSMSDAIQSIESIANEGKKDIVLKKAD